MSNKRIRRKPLTILYLKCPICIESSHISQWAIACFDNPSYQRSVPTAEELNEESCMICPKCLKSTMYRELMRMQKYLSNY